MERRLFVGDVVVLKCGCLGNVAGVRGVVYEEYDYGAGPGASVIFANGEYDGFAFTEQNDFFEKVAHCEHLEDYQFQNVIKLSQDYRAGRFDPALFKF